MRKKPFYLPIAILITTLALGISVPAFFLANHSGQAGFSTIEATPTLQPKISIIVPPGREITQENFQNCTYHAYHWVSQPEAWPAQVTLGGVTYTRAEMLNLRDAPQGDPAIDLVKEVLIAIVNIYNGASQSSIESTLIDADNWLSDHQAEGELSEFNQQQALSLTATLTSYNNGKLYPAPCPDQIPLPVAELASDEANRTDTAILDDNQPLGDKQNGTSTTFQSGPTDTQPTGTPPDRSIVQRPTDTPIAPPSQIPPGNPDNDNPGRGHGSGNSNPGRDNGNGKSNSGQGNQGQGNENRGQGNKGGGNDNPGHENKGGGEEKPGPGNEGSKKGGGNDNPGQEVKAHGKGEGNGDPGNGNKGKGQEDGSGKGDGDKGKGDESGSGRGEGDKGKGQEDGSGKGEDDKGKDKDKKGP